MFLNALLSSQESKGNPRGWSRGRIGGGGRGEVGDEERQGRAGGGGSRRRSNLKPEQSRKKRTRGLRVTISQQPRVLGAGNELESLDLGKWRKCT